MIILLIVMFYLVIILFDYFPNKKKLNKLEKRFYFIVTIFCSILNSINSFNIPIPAIATEIGKMLE